MRRVGVFVNEARASVERIAQAAALDVAQLHGDEAAAEYPAAVAVWKAARVSAGFDLAQFDGCPAEALLLDGPAGELYGGAGQAFDWRLAAGAPRRIILAGGLDALQCRDGRGAGASLGRGRLLADRERTGKKGPQEDERVSCRRRRRRSAYDGRNRTRADTSDPTAGATCRKC